MTKLLAFFVFLSIFVSINACSDYWYDCLTEDGQNVGRVCEDTCGRLCRPCTVKSLRKCQTKVNAFATRTVITGEPCDEHYQKKFSKMNRHNQQQKTGQENDQGQKPTVQGQNNQEMADTGKIFNQGPQGQVKNPGQQKTAQKKKHHQKKKDYESDTDDDTTDDEDD